MAVVNITATVAAVASTGGNALRDPLVFATAIATSAATGNALRDPLVSATVAAVTLTTAAGTKIHFATAAVTAGASTSGVMIKGVPVTDATSLSNIRNNLSKDYAQLSNIDLSGIANWEPIGTLVAPFTGTLDGAGFTVTSLTIDRSGTDYVGLFGVCDFSGYTEPRLIDIVIISASVTGRDSTGALAGKLITDYYNESIAINTAFNLVSGCSSTGAVTGRSFVGGLIGQTVNTGAVHDHYNWYHQVNNAYITQCYSAAIVTGTGSYIGGLIGRVYGFRAHRSRATGAVTGGNIVGGFVGEFYWAASEQCYATGAVEGERIVGGFFGASTQRAWHTKSYAEGNVIGTGVYARPELYNTGMGGGGVGGFGGYWEIENLWNCFALGNVEGCYRVGGMFGSAIGGLSDPSLQHSYAHGNVLGVGEVGGVIGYIFPRLFGFRQVYCTGSVTGNYRGAIIGQRGAPYFASDPIGQITYRTPVYFNSDANSASTFYGGTGKTVAQLGVDSTFDSDWQQFDMEWIIDIEESDFPILLWAYDPVGISLAVLNTGQGLLLAYTQEGATKYRAFDGTDWAATVAVPELPVPAGSLSLCPTQDDRAVFVADVDGILHYAVTGTLTLAIQHTGELLPGAFGNLIHLADNRLKLYLVNAVQALTEAETVLADWDAVLFEGITPLPSDSFISRLRAKLIDGKTYAVWRSRGQHRAMVKDEVEVVPEVDDVPAGSIVLRQDTPVVLVSLELDAFEREVE